MKNGPQLRQNRQRDRDAHNPHEGHAQHKNQPRKTDGAGLPLLRCLAGQAVLCHVSSSSLRVDSPNSPLRIWRADMAAVCFNPASQTTFFQG